MKMFRKIQWLIWALGVCISLSFVFSCRGSSTTTPSTTTSSKDFTITSSAVENGQLLPQYQCEPKVDGVENSIPLSWANVPEGTGSLAIVMTHYPNPSDLTHPNTYLLLWGIDPSVTEIPYGKADDGPWFMGPNKDGVAISYTSPCSPSAGAHEYTITIYALAQMPASLPRASSLEVTYDVLMNALATVTVIGSAQLTFINVTSQSVDGQPGGKLQDRPTGRQQANAPRTPPQAAIDACAGKRDGAICQFISPRGDNVTGTCETKQDLSACKPNARPKDAGKPADAPSGE